MYFVTASGQGIVFKEKGKPEEDIAWSGSKEKADFLVKAANFAHENYEKFLAYCDNLKTQSNGRS